MQKSVFTISMYVVAQQRSPEKCIFMSCTYICHGYTKGFVMSSNFRPMVLNPRCRKNCTYIFLHIISSNVCFKKTGTKRSSVLLLRFVPVFLKQTLGSGVTYDGLLAYFSPPGLFPCYGKLAKFNQF